MLEVAAQHKFHFDACQMPLNVMDAHFRSFAHQVVPAARKEGIAVLGMKPMGDGQCPEEQRGDAGRVPALRVVAADFGGDQRSASHGAPGPGLRSGAHVQAADRAEMSTLLAKTAAAAMTGKYEPFKTTSEFDGTAHNPQWMG